MEAFLGPLHPVLKNRYYLDDVYGAVFVKPSQWLAVQVIAFLDRGIIDAILHVIARVFTWIGDLIKVLNLWLIDGVGDGIPIAIFNFGGWLRRMQTRTRTAVYAPGFGGGGDDWNRPGSVVGCGNGAIGRRIHV